MLFNHLINNDHFLYALTRIPSHGIIYVQTVTGTYLYLCAITALHIMF